MTAVQIPPPVDSALINLPYHTLSSPDDLNPLIDAVANARVVLLGEATHGTSDFFRWRAAISQKLITEKGFNSIAVEGDWTDAEKINKFIKGPPGDSIGADSVLKQFDRWPVWSWANTDVAFFITWLNRYNQQLADSAKISFTGTDVFSLYDVLDEMMQLIKDTAIIKRVKNFSNCFERNKKDERSYGKDTNCSKQAELLLSSIQQFTASDKNERYKLLQAASTIFDGEQYLGTVTRKKDGWNIREYHMANTILRILSTFPKSKIIVWQHNSHAGDAAFSSMHSHNRTSVGEILRKQLGDSSVFITGFGTYAGTVTAARTWGGITETMPLANAEPGTWEQLFHEQGNENRYILFEETRNNTLLQNRWLYMRNIGVLYFPGQRSGASLSLLAKRFDAFIFIDHSTALHPLAAPTNTRNETPGDE